jgi:hypothetical protein
MKAIRNLKLSLIYAATTAALGSLPTSASAQSPDNYNKDGEASWDWGETDETICWDDTSPIFEDEIVAQIIQTSPPSARKKWRSYFLRSYLDNHTVNPSNYIHIDQWDYNGPQGKWMIGAYLVEYGINSSVMPVQSTAGISLLSRPWHGRYDYRRNAKARGTRAHYKYGPRYSKETPTNGTIGRHNWKKYIGGHTEKVTLYCPLFQPGDYRGHPMLRASVQVHEGQHSREYRYRTFAIPGSAYGHKTCIETHDDGSKRKYDCDQAVLHSRYAYGNGEMYRSYEKPYQTGYEFGCDLAEHANSWVPSDVRLRAVSEAKYSRDQLTNNESLPYCGNPYPFGRKTAEKPYCVAGGTCGCSNGLTLCSNVCVDVSSNKTDCGACGNTCSSGPCINGTCNACQTASCGTAADCAGAYYACNNGCCADAIQQ